LDGTYAAISELRVPVIFCRELWRLRQPGKSGQLTPTPAMMAGLVDTLWTIGDLYDAVMKQQAEKKHPAARPNSGAVGQLLWWVNYLLVVRHLPHPRRWKPASRLALPRSD
jgi:hypothetical protein